jgi:hypothetical protein
VLYNLLLLISMFFFHNMQVAGNMALAILGIGWNILLSVVSFLDVILSSFLAILSVFDGLFSS